MAGDTSVSVEHAHSLESARELASRYADAVRAHFAARLRDVWLYGSAARGDWSEESDIDVMVVLDEVTLEDGDWLVRTAFRQGIMQTGLLVQPVFFSAREFEELESRERRIALDVKREGIPL